MPRYGQGDQGLNTPTAKIGYMDIGTVSRKKRYKHGYDTETDMDTDIM